MRNISFSLTTDQIRDRTKTVTRRIGWKHAKPGMLLMACVKCMGLKPGDQIERLCIIQVVDVRREALSKIHYEGREGCAKEGFPDLQPHQFVGMFQHNMKCSETTPITRIEFRYVPGGAL